MNSPCAVTNARLLRCTASLASRPSPKSLFAECVLSRSLGSMAKQFQLAQQSILTFVATRDPDRAKRFYRDTLGLPLVAEELPFALVFDVNGTMLRVTIVEKLTPAPFTVLGWQVPNITVAAKALQKAGVEFQRYPGLPQDQLGIWTSPSGAKVAWFRDPDGNTLSLSQH